jgi:hypothetical protein
MRKKKENSYPREIVPEILFYLLTPIPPGLAVSHAS